MTRFARLFKDVARGLVEHEPAVHDVRARRAPARGARRPPRRPPPRRRPRACAGPAGPPRPRRRSRARRRGSSPAVARSITRTFSPTSTTSPSSQIRTWSAGDADLGRDLGVVRQVTPFAVDRDEPPRAHQRRASAGAPPAAAWPLACTGYGGQVEHVRAGPVQPVDHAVDRGLVAGISARRQHDAVARP